MAIFFRKRLNVGDNCMHHFFTIYIEMKQLKKNIKQIHKENEAVPSSLVEFLYVNLENFVDFIEKHVVFRVEL
jgi:hypothetical protein